jgi:hypothetical protein
MNVPGKIFLMCVQLVVGISLEAEEAVKPLMRDFIGINGHFKFRPALYKPVCGLVRNYHNINWDVKKPGDPITFPVCVNKVNWERDVYGKWVKEGFEVNLCAMFGRFGEGNENYLELWKGQEEWMYRYGFEMAKAFGPSGERKLVTSIEIGNEPGNDFEDTLYQRLFVQMAKGIRAADPEIKIVTAAARSGEADKYSKSLQETYGSPEIVALYDVINVHTYAVSPKQEGRSPWHRSYPEDPEIAYLKEVDAAIAFRDRRTPGKEVWVTEFGYDASTEKALTRREGWAKKLNWKGVTDKQQAQYIVRSLLCFAERDVQRAYIYFYNDEDKASVHAASGLTRNFEPKTSYWAVKHIYETLGDFRFQRVVQKKEGELYVYEFANDDQIIWVLWSPTGNGREAEVTLTDLPGRLLKVEQMPLEDVAAPLPQGKMLHANALEMTVSESPIYLRFGTNKPAP